MATWQHGNMAYAQVTVLTNYELDEVAIATQSILLEPVLPKYDLNGQVAGIAGTQTGSNVPVAGSLTTPVATPTASSSANGGIALQLPVSPLSSLISNLPRNIGH